MQKLVLYCAIICVMAFANKSTFGDLAESEAHLPRIVRRMLEAKRMSSTVVGTLESTKPVFNNDDLETTTVLAQNTYYQKDLVDTAECATAPVSTVFDLPASYSDTLSQFSSTVPESSLKWISDYYAETILGHPLGIALLITACVGMK